LTYVRLPWFSFPVGWFLLSSTILIENSRGVKGTLTVRHRGDPASSTEPEAYTEAAIVCMIDPRVRNREI